MRITPCRSAATWPVPSRRSEWSRPPSQASCSEAKAGKPNGLRAPERSTPAPTDPAGCPMRRRARRLAPCHFCGLRCGIHRPRRDSAAVCSVQVVRSEAETSKAASFKTTALDHSATPPTRDSSVGLGPPSARLRIRNPERVRLRLGRLRVWQRDLVRRRGLTATHGAL
jgi:hypothetical protein